MRVRRSFSNDFKKQVVESIVSGSATQAELSREYKISLEEFENIINKKDKESESHQLVLIS